MDSSQVLYETRERVAYITLNRPDSMNALSQQMFGELHAAIERIRDDDEILAGVLTGDRIEAERALRIGLIQEVVADREALDAAVGRLTDSIRICAPLALQAIKQVVYRGRYVPPEYAEQMSAPLALLVNASEDAKE